MVSLNVEIPDFYYKELRKTLQQNPNMSQDDFFLAAISRYLSERQIQEAAIESQIKKTLAA